MKIQIIVMALVVFLTSCASGPKEINYGDTGDGYVLFNDLVSNPDDYNLKKICVKGIYLSGFESSTLGESTYERDGYLYLQEPTIWIGSRDLVTEKCTEPEVRNSYSFCQADVCGVFEYGERYGHLGGYAYQIRH
ncbi:MAG: hypothetical protein KKG59_07410 [Nanoarchaeota archaeon]|nr:hypothetical protein [Nanoarchaeota archaeon]